MAVRTTPTAVCEVLADNYDGSTDLTAFIATASAVVDDVVDCAAEVDVTLSAARKELLERWLAAHYYTVADPLYTSKKTQDASGTFKLTSYYEAAEQLDPSGCLTEMKKGKVSAELTWLGKPPSDQTDYVDRD